MTVVLVIECYIIRAPSRGARHVTKPTKRSLTPTAH
jgi:hypothetical protein